ncbi:hypothetical protein [Actinokineospora bangkokensis]|uniref:Uncharacterized protein n=1 Tax=Actinokineospora bangkokensis TaxID=1193682 RepID=A0A1Q9LFL8_9PSEU|nr:hypothetical protein [Actinokineospora bangkokensis]OLR90832.1 hypothetical protein BJP25_30160 [Actinokineospora bangkokensis]
MADIEYRFGTGQGAPNVHHGAADADVDGDGTADAVALDFDGDGRYDDAMWDSDGDGVADTALLDLDDDGVAESAYHDPTGQGTWNAEGRGGQATEPTQQEQPPERTDEGGYENQPADDDPADDDADDPEPTADEPAGAAWDDFLDSLHDHHDLHDEHDAGADDPGADGLHADPDSTGW